MSPVLLPEAMTRFKCNEKGCCCKGWSIPFEPEDLLTVLDAFREEERSEMTEEWTFWVDADGAIQKWSFGRVGDENACQFLATDGRCGLQVRKGVDALPHLCRAFPAFAFEIAGSGEIEMHFDAICPSVLDRIDEGDDRFGVTRVVPEAGTELAVRTSRPIALPPIQLGPRELTYEELSLLRDRVLEALDRRACPALDTLARVHYAIGRIVAGQPVAEFALRDDDPLEPFDAYFDDCMNIHQDRLVAYFCREYRRFIWDIPLDGVDWEALAPHLAPDPDWRQRIDPRAAELQPLLSRFLSHRFFSPFDRSPAANRLTFTYGTITHTLATTFRIAAGLSAWLDRPVDRTLLKVSLGAAEYVYRSLRTPPTSMPWFEPSGEDLSEVRAGTGMMGGPDSDVTAGTGLVGGPEHDEAIGTGTAGVPESDATAGAGTVGAPEGEGGVRTPDG